MWLLFTFVCMLSVPVSVDLHGWLCKYAVYMCVDGVFCVHAYWACWTQGCARGSLTFLWLLDSAAP